MPYQPAILGPNTRLNNFRLGYLTADQRTFLRITIGGIDVTQPDSPMRMIYKSMTIRDLVFDAPNTCALTLYGPQAPTVGQPIEVWLNANDPVLLFGGELQTVEHTYKGRPSTVVYPVTAIDDTARANRRRPLRPYHNVSATTIAQELIATYAPGFSSAGVQANLPAVSITFDGSEGGMKGCLTALAKLVGGYWYFEHKTLYLFVTPPGPSPDPIDDTPGRFLHDPAITWSIDKSQVRTRVYGKGASTRISTSIVAATDLVPLENGEMFTPSGGQAIAALTPDGAACRVLTYTGVQLGGGGGLVGPGAAPSAAPALAPLDGAGIESGAHSYAITFTTAAGESVPGPIATIAVGVTPAPGVGPVPGLSQVGGAMDPGDYHYFVTFVTAVGETTASPPSAWVTTTAAIAAPTPRPPNFSGDTLTGLANNLTAGAWYAWRYTFVRSADGAETLPSATTQIGYPNINPPGYVPSCAMHLAATPPAGYSLRWYRCKAAASEAAAIAAPMYRVVSGAAVVGGVFADGGADSALGPLAPTGNTTGTGTVPLSGIPIGPANVTARRIYRYSAAAPYRLVDTIANNTASTYTDTKANASLGAALPSSNTAVANRVQITLPLGGATVTGRKIYRTAAGQSLLQFLGTIGENTSTSVTDTQADAVLGAGPPATDTSGLVQPSGQVPAGSTTLILANPAPFAAGGGWAVVGNGEQVIYYAGKSATALTGIPASGPGAIVASISYNSTVTAAPALVGVTGILEGIIRNSPIHVWVQRDDLAAQAAMATLDGGGDGVYEHIWSDERRSEASLIQVCDAQLQLYSRPLATVVYASRDQKTKSGKTVTIALTTPAIHESLTIQDVTITEIGIRGLVPKFTVTASHNHTTLESVLRMLIRKAES